jgi:hypothetical protein
MEYQEKILLLVTVLLIALAVYLTLTAPVAKPATNITNVSTNGVEELLLKGLSFGTGQVNYVYAYNVVSDGYNTSYVLTKNGNDSLIAVQDPLSTKEVYFLSNDTILCMTYEGAENCASVQNQSLLANYLELLHVQFFNDALIRDNKNDLSYLVSNGYIKLNPILTNDSVNGNPCTEITYVLDYTNISVAEAAHFGVSATTPKVFNWSMCVGSSTGYPWEKSFNYTYDAMLQTYTVDMVSYNPLPPVIVVPKNLSGDVITPLLAEMGQQEQLADCYTTKQGEPLDTCLANFALTNRQPAICQSTGALVDRCLFTIVQLTNDANICPTILSQPYKDDCYIELAGFYKNSSWCADLQNASNMAQCMNVSIPVVSAPIAIRQSNATAGENGSIQTKEGNMTINEFLNYQEETTDNATPAAPPANGTNATAPANQT